jgi:hypothetical protein
VLQRFIDFKTQTKLFNIFFLALLVFFFFTFSMNLFLLHIVIILKEFSDLMLTLEFGMVEINLATLGIDFLFIMSIL